MDDCHGTSLCLFVIWLCFLCVTLRIKGPAGAHADLWAVWQGGLRLRLQKVQEVLFYRVCQTVRPLLSLHFLHWHIYPEGCPDQVSWLRADSFWYSISAASETLKLTAGETKSDMLPNTQAQIIHVMWIKVQNATRETEVTQSSTETMSHSVTWFNFMS